MQMTFWLWGGVNLISLLHHHESSFIHFICFTLEDGSDLAVIYVKEVRPYFFLLTTLQYSALHLGI